MFHFKDNICSGVHLIVDTDGNNTLHYYIYTYVSLSARRCLVAEDVGSFNLPMNMYPQQQRE